MEKYGDLQPEKSKSDFNLKQASFYDIEGFEVADEENKNKLKNPQRIVEDVEEEK